MGKCRNVAVQSHGAVTQLVPIKVKLTIRLPPSATTEWMIPVTRTRRFPTKAVLVQISDSKGTKSGPERLSFCATYRSKEFTWWWFYLRQEYLMTTLAAE
jgi:hypothetical protein